jgi:hypothetical protein
MSSVAVVIIVFVALSFSLVKLLAILNASYEEAAGQARMVRAHTPWLRSMRAERERYPGERPRLTTPERILVVVAVIAILIFEIWFFFFSGSPIDQRTGRSALPGTLASLSNV